MLKKLLSKTPSANGLKAKIDGLMFIVSLLILLAECAKMFREGYKNLTNDESGKSSTAAAGNNDNGATNEQE